MRQCFSLLFLFVISVCLTMCSTTGDQKLSPQPTPTNSLNNTIEKSKDSLNIIDSIVFLEKDAPYIVAVDTISKVSFLLDDLLKIESEVALIKKFGKDNVARGFDINDCTLETNPTSILFPNTKNEVRCRWIDPINFTNLSSVSHYGYKSDWKTSEGIALGTTIDVLEKLNEGPFTFNAFGWDYEGQIIWNYPMKHNKGILLALGVQNEKLAKSLFSNTPLQISSDTDSIKKNNLIVGTIELWDMERP